MVSPATALSSIATMLSNTRRPLGKPAASPARRPMELAEPAGGGGNAAVRRRQCARWIGGARYLQPQHGRRPRPGEVLEPGHDPGRNPGEQDRVEVRPVLRVAGEVREQPGVEDGQVRRELGLVEIRLDLAGVVDRVDGVPAVLVPDVDDDLVEERVAETRHLHTPATPLPALAG